MNIVIQYDASAANAPAGFKSAVQAAVQYMDGLITAPITVPIVFSYGVINGQAMSSGALGESSGNGWFVSYSQLVSALGAAATTADAMASVLTLPGADPTSNGTWWLADAQAKALGFGGDANFQDPQDGFVALTNSAPLTFDPNNRAVPGAYDAVGILEHEISEILGRTSGLGSWAHSGAPVYSTLDLFRYSSAGVRSLNQSAGYFSVDGKTMLLPFNNPTGGVDGGDWSVTGDSFGYGLAGVTSAVSATDVRELNVLGYGVSTAGGATPVLNLAYADYVADAANRALITHAYTIALSGAPESARASVETDSHVASLAVSDSAANIAAAIDALNADTRVSSIVIADNQPITVTAAQNSADGRAFGELVNANGAKATVVVAAAAPTPQPTPQPTPGAGQTLTASAPGSALTGGAGNDTLYGSQGGDTLTGGAGADTFVFQKQPWAPETITDFVVGTDKLDLSAMFKTYGYTGSDPIKDGWIFLYADGNGGTIIRFADHTGASQWPNTIIDLQHVANVGLSWSALSAVGSASSPPSSTPVSAPTPAPAASGVTLTASGPGQTITGGAGNDTLVGGPGNDTLTGGAGLNTFKFISEPWAPNTVTDFKPGTDKLDLSGLFAKYGYTGTDPIHDGWMFVYSDGNGGSILRFADHTGASQWPNTIIDLQHVAPSQVAVSDWILH